MKTRKKQSGPDLIIVGAGLVGLTIAERVANVLGKSVQVYEHRNHIGGNAHSFKEPETGIEIHKYGTHIFHTSNSLVLNYVSQFMSLNSYRHRVFSQHNGKLFDFPINKNTLDSFFNIDLQESEVNQFLETLRIIPENGRNPKNLEEKALQLVGRDLYEAFIKGYTKKQWQEDLRELPASIISRIPVRSDGNTDYFDDKYQGVPRDGYGSWFAKMTESDNIEIQLNTDFFDAKAELDPSIPIVYTGPIDRYFNYQHGLLGWRTLDFKVLTKDVDSFQEAAVINYPDLSEPFTRIHEFKKLHPEVTYKEGKSIIMYEYSRAANESDAPYYPMNRGIDRELLSKYRENMKAENKVFFVGRLATYAYLDMDMAIASALNVFENKLIPLLEMS
jgi:UDP-galactopyranose mutase